MFGYVTLIYINNEILPYFYLSNVRDLEQSHVWMRTTLSYIIYLILLYLSCFSVCDDFYCISYMSDPVHVIFFL